MAEHIDSLTTSGFKGDILFPNNSYHSEDDAWHVATRSWGAQDKRNPQLALKPLSPEDVSLAIRWLNKHNLDFAVRSGGNAESQSDSVIIDLGHFKKISYDSTSGLVSLGPGLTWREVYSTLSSPSSPSTHNITVVGGRVGCVGVGGFLLGGGLSLLSHEYGLGSQNVVDVQVVLADGRIVWAKEEEKKEGEGLLKAIRGAGYSFGVITEFVVRAVPRPTSVVGGFLMYTMDKFEALTTRLSKFTEENKNPHVGTMLGVLKVPPEGHHMAMLMPFVAVYKGEDATVLAKSKEGLGWAWDLAPVHDATSVMAYEHAIFAQDAFVRRPATSSNYQLHSAVVSTLSSSVLKAGVDWQTKLYTLGPRFFGAGLLYEPFFKNALNSSSSSPSPAPSSYPPLPSCWPPQSTSGLHVLELFMEQPNAENGHWKENAAHMREGARAIEEQAKKEGIKVLHRYPNYALGGTKADEFYGEEGVRYLRQLKRKYDPNNRFNKGIQIGV